MEVEKRQLETSNCGVDVGTTNVSRMSKDSADTSETEVEENINKTPNHKEGTPMKAVHNSVTKTTEEDSNKNENATDVTAKQAEELLLKVTETNERTKSENIEESNESMDKNGPTFKESKSEENSNDLNELDDSQDAAEDDDESQKGDVSTADDDNSLSPSTQSQTPPLRDTTNATSSASIAAAMGVAASVVVAAAGIRAAIPDTILSPPKSETQTDDANTATSSSSPASDSQLSPMITEASIGSSAALTPTTPPELPEIAATGLSANVSNMVNCVGSSPTKTATKRGANPIDADAEGGGKRVIQPINLVANGTIPKSSGKPLMSAMNKKLKEKPTRAPRQRKQKSTLPMYESEISDNKTGIKLCIKKSDSTGNLSGTTGILAPTVTAKVVETTTTAIAPKQTRKRSRKAKSKVRLDDDESEPEVTTGKRGKNRASNAERQKKVSFSGIEEQGEKHRASIEQGDWGARIPQEILFKIFEILIDREGCLPTLCRLGRVCTLWRNVALTPSLWKSMDLSTWIKDKYRTELKLKWFVDNRCSECTELNVANWKMSDINCFLNKLAIGCPNLTSITLSGWKGFTSDHLAYLTENMQKLQRLDLSSVNSEMNASKSAVGPQSLCNALQTMNSRLTHLYLAHNRLAGIPQIVATLATHCPNLVNLDLSNVTTQATSHGIFHIEKLQHGCPKLKVLRVTNSHITWGNATLQETMDSPGFPELEELSVAALTDECRVIGDDQLQRILKTSSKLKLLDVRGCARLTHESLIRLPAWDIKHLFLSFCSVTRDVGSGLELIASKWAHSLIELDLAWANVQQPLDNALRALAEKGSESPLAHLNLCGSSVSDDAVKEILANCAHMSSINLSSCRGLPRGVKRLMQGQQELQELREVLKVQMKVKLPAQIKQEKEEEERRQRAAQSGSSTDADSGGGGDGGGNFQSN
ncbi:F-box/LRR-repeat protein 6 isoform X2 [Zeugodacus cucurbitae]|nr:F-box/LRR-repeat protein 6 isoform X2 [Zeugodacus cucurbitae]XP_011178802.2 F-box/LRR-repeat protein 6 isoform X2 [Zeugodacus cucurbitae]